MLTCCASDLEPTKTSRVKKKGWFFRIITKHVAPLQIHTGFGINFNIRSFPSFITTSSSSIYHQVCKVMLRRCRRGWNHVRSTIKASPSSINSCLSVSKLSGVCGDGGNINTLKPENPASEICTLQTTEPWTSYINTNCAHCASFRRSCTILLWNSVQITLQGIISSFQPRRPTKRKNGGSQTSSAKSAWSSLQTKLDTWETRYQIVTFWHSQKKNTPCPWALKIQSHQHQRYLAKLFKNLRQNEKTENSQYTLEDTSFLITKNTFTWYQRYKWYKWHKWYKWCKWYEWYKWHRHHYPDPACCCKPCHTFRLLETSSVWTWLKSCQAVKCFSRGKRSFPKGVGPINRIGC